VEVLGVEMDILLTDEEIGKLEWESATLDMRFADDYKAEVKALLKAQRKKALIGIGKEVKKLDGTTYLIPDYKKYREAVKEMGLDGS